MWRSNAVNQLGGTPAFGLTKYTPVTNGVIAKEDFNTTNDTRLATDIPITTITSSQYYNFTLNSDGFAAINKTGNTNLMVRFDWDIDNSYGGDAWTGSEYMYWSIITSDYNNPARTPFIQITYHTGSAPASSFTVTKTVMHMPMALSVTDNSTGIPTSWNWSWGDGTWSNLTSNPNTTHKYTKRGKFPVSLLTSNAQGNNTSASQNIRIVGYENLW